MDGRDLVRSLRTLRGAGAAGGLRTLRAAWRRRRTDSAGLPPRGPERARVPGAMTGVEPGPGGGVVRFERSELRITVTLGGTVFLGWEGASPLPSWALAGAAPVPDLRAVLEPDKDGGWRVVAERVTVIVSRHGAVEVHTPGGVLLRRDRAPRWWQAQNGGETRWVQRSEVSADARFFGLGGRACGPRLRDGQYRMWNTDPQGGYGPQDGPLHTTMPVQLVVADAGTHLVFHDTSWDATVTLREGEEGAGSGHDRAGAIQLRVEGGPLRCWVVVGTPARVLHTWAMLTGAPALPPGWALGHHHVLSDGGSEQQVREIVAGHHARGLPLEALHLVLGHGRGGRSFTVDVERFPKLPQLAGELLAEGVRLVSAVSPAVKAEPGHTVFDSGVSAGVFVRDAAGRLVRGEAQAGESVYPDVTGARGRIWWGERYEERLEQGFAGFWHTLDEPVARVAFGDATLPRSARHDLDGHGGDHRSAHNVYGLGLLRAAHEALSLLRPGGRPFLLARSGWVGMQRYGGAWAGEVADTWEGLRSALSVVLGLGLCGVPLAAPDLGGGRGEAAGELRVRQLQLAAYLPLLRTAGAGHPGGEPFGLADEMAEHARVALAERRRLGPYLMTLAHLSRRTGAPWVRPVWWSSPENRALRDCEDAFLLGEALLVAPVMEEGARARTVRLPAGRWYDTCTEEAHEGPGQVVVPAPLSRAPVLARAGAVVPVLGGSGGIELEVWAPAVGRPGGGFFVDDPGDGWAVPETERYRTRRAGERVTVQRETGKGPRTAGRPVRIRGL
ncbi:glycoside hydrolase family 31 protein [Streptomyces sp. TS71-3]|uniref:glycoside hydrolase family 31 protein n=1 Tax=Streptomyces sp. TS71-3 TaxID=2733862 RepID=UPI001B1207B7|nr:glycoside hydrolase family 31 protein [Streptomyces sp. TS71-3]GHJ39005.1 glycosyl hydrolase [Streptomyces sp. TS71-3]